MMATRVFISYRRNDSAGHAGRVHDRLAQEFGADLLFMDVDNLPLGADFIKALHKEVAKCRVLLAVIGPGWLDVRDGSGQRRLNNPNDFVRVEIAAALQRKIPVIPILLEGTAIPSADQLPPDLQELSVRHGINVRHDSFHSDMDRLIRGLKGQMASKPVEPQKPPGQLGEPPTKLSRERRPIFMALVVAIIGLASLIWWATDRYRGSASNAFGSSCGDECAEASARPLQTPTRPVLMPPNGTGYGLH
jgi:TIR domain